MMPELVVRCIAAIIICHCVVFRKPARRDLYKDPGLEHRQSSLNIVARSAGLLSCHALSHLPRPPYLVSASTLGLAPIQCCLSFGSSRLSKLLRVAVSVPVPASMEE